MRPPTGPRQFAATIGNSRIPAIIYSPSPEGQPRGEAWARGLLELLARKVLEVETAARKRQRRQKILRAARPLITALTEAPDVTAEAVNVIAEFTTMAETWASPRAGGRPVENSRDWLFEKVLFVWEECDGTIRISGHSGGGPLGSFLRVVCNPVLKACGRKLLTEGATRAAVRKLSAKRRPK
jgi:hypothetical protein